MNSQEKVRTNPAFAAGKLMTRAGRALLCGVLGLLASVNAGADEESGWIELFDGKTFQGWVHYNGSHRFSIEDGAIVGTTVPDSANSFLCTTRQFSDFEFEVEVWMDRVTNSGIQFRSKTRPETIGKGWESSMGRVFGPQAEIRRGGNPGEPTTGMFYGEALGTGWLSSKETIEKGHNSFRNEEWNRLRVVAEGARMRSWVNGNLVDDLMREDVFRTHSEGFIGLQVHGVKNEGPFVMKFRNIRIRPLQVPATR